MLAFLFLSTSIDQAATAAGTTASAQANMARGPQSAKEVEKFLDDYFSQDPIKKKINALTVAVVQNGQVLARKGYGVTDRSTNTPVQPDQTVFRVASVSKVFTALAIMQLVDQGKIGLQDNIEKYLDGYKVNNPFATPVTVEMLLTHSTGFEVRDQSSNSFMVDGSLTPVSRYSDNTSIKAVWFRSDNDRWHNRLWFETSLDETRRVRHAIQHAGTERLDKKKITPKLFSGDLFLSCSTRNVVATSI
ncbi:serine hydrolase [Paenibacillus sp. SYP-B3998]|uniref:Serine hydrolase n=1 Tax=Paenibacillus sp. SYP-B3998 TaxID=2678564 RepID=A0A6G4A1T8_9BACL|nr:serine hydrolase domain-containing protein [Paenibacillus sp. SYP-B3998]NEW08345.1 serine hydrolase [Paenibacillus sp. SYP-B3998]